MNLPRKNQNFALIGILCCILIVGCDSGDSLTLVTAEPLPPNQEPLTPIETAEPSTPPIGFLPTPLPTPVIISSPEPNVPSVTPVEFIPAIRATINWQSVDDLDLFIVDPTGARVFFGNRSVPSGGTLTIDANAACASTVTRPVEDIFFPPGAIPGDYLVGVNLFQRCAGGVPAPSPVPFRLTINLQGQVQVFEGSVTSGADFLQTFNVSASS